MTHTTYEELFKISREDVIKFCAENGGDPDPDILDVVETLILFVTHGNRERAIEALNESEKLRWLNRERILKSRDITTL